MDWHKRSNNYDKTHWVTNNDLLKNFFKYLDKNRTYIKVLEIGMGTGVVSKYFIKTYNYKKFYGLDNSLDMLNKIDNENIEKIHASCNKLDFEDNFFDLIIIRNVFHYLNKEDKEKTIKEIKRTLKNEGIFIFSQVVPFDKSISAEYDRLINRNIHYNTKDELINLIGSELNIYNNYPIILKQNSIKNWASNTNQDVEKVLEKHKNLSKPFKEFISYNEINDDILVDIKHFIIYSKK